VLQNIQKAKHLGNRYDNVGDILLVSDSRQFFIEIKKRMAVKILNDFKIIFPDNKTHCKIVGIGGNSVEPLLQIVFHWKNIAQGIKTPCLNIFDLTARE